MINKVFVLKDINNNILADVILFTDSKCVVKWRGPQSSIVIHDSINNFVNVSLNVERQLIAIPSIEELKQIILNM